MQPVAQTGTTSPMLNAYTIEQLLAILSKSRNKMQAVTENETGNNSTHEREQIAKEVTAVIDEINFRLAPFKARISFDELPGTHVDTFMFSFNNPLDNMPVKHILGCEIVGAMVHFQIVDKDGKKSMRKTFHNAYISNQIEQFRIPIEAHQA